MKELISLVLILGALSGILAFTLAIYLMPPTDDFHPENPYWNGMHKLTNLFQLKIIDNFTELSEYKPRETALLIIGPSKPFNSSEINYVNAFLSEGGLVLLVDDFGTGNDLLRGLNIPLRLNGHLLADSFQGEKIGYMPRAKIYLKDLNELILNYATVIERSEKNTTNILLISIAYSSPLSFLDLNLNKFRDEKEPRGPFPVAILALYGNGSFILISDSSVFINAMIELGDNLKLLKTLIGDRLILLDTSHWVPSTLTIIKRRLSNMLSFLRLPEVKYLLLISASILIFHFRKPLLKKDKNSIDEVLERHPTWDEKLLRRLQEDLS